MSSSAKESLNAPPDPIASRNLARSNATRRTCFLLAFNGQRGEIFILNCSIVGGIVEGGQWSMVLATRDTLSSGCKAAETVAGTRRTVTVFRVRSRYRRYNVSSLLSWLRRFEDDTVVELPHPAQTKIRRELRQVVGISCCVEPDDPFVAKGRHDVRELCLAPR